MEDVELAARPELMRWLFPIGGSSDPDAPVIGRRELRVAVQADVWLQDAMRRAFQRMVAALGLAERDGALRWRAEAQPWALAPRKDWRVYRMLRSLWNDGWADEATMLMRFLERDPSGDPQRAEALAWFRHQVAS